MSEYAHIMREIAKIEAEERATKDAVDELVYAAELVLTRVRLDLLPRRHPGWGGGVLERLETAIATLRSRTTTKGSSDE